MPTDELSSFLENQITMNPFLEMDESETDEEMEDEDLLYDEGQPSGKEMSENIAASPLTLHQHLTQQIESTFCPDEQPIAEQMLFFLDNKGYITETPSQIAAKLRQKTETVQRILEKLKQLDPTGIFSASFEESLSLQLQEKGLLDDAYQKLILMFSDLSKGQVDATRLHKILDVPKESLQEMLGQLQRLSPYPTHAFESGLSETINPDVKVFWNTETQSWDAKLMGRRAANLSFNRAYYDETKAQTKTKQEKSYLSQQLSHGNWLQKALQQRNETLLAVSKEIVKHQQGYFEKGPAFLRPLILQDIALRISVHESTVSRITTEKYITTPRGIFELKHFFSSGFEHTHNGKTVSSHSIRTALQKMIDQESQKKPLSDCVLTKLLNAQGIPIARRTVAKYREELNIAPSFKRKQYYVFQQSTGRPKTAKK